MIEQMFGLKKKKTLNTSVQECCHLFLFLHVFVSLIFSGLKNVYANSYQAYMMYQTQLTVHYSSTEFSHE